MSDLEKAARQAIALICSARLCDANSASSRREMLGLLIDATDVLRTGLEQDEPVVERICRTDGRCQYAIDRDAEDLGHCPEGKCVMPDGEEQGERND